MTRLPDPKPKQLVAQVRPDAPAAPLAEIQVGPGALCLTLWLPRLEAADADVVLTPHCLRLRSKSEPRLDLLVALPVAVDPSRYVLRINHGLFDLCAERAARSR